MNYGRVGTRLFYYSPWEMDVTGTQLVVKEPRETRNTVPVPTSVRKSQDEVEGE